VPDDRAAVRDAAARADDHAGIGRLVDVLVPALIAKIGTLNVGELEVREGDWRVRLRRPAGVGPTFGRRATDRPSRTHPGHEHHAHAPGAPEPHRAARTGPPSSAAASAPAAGASAAPTNGSNAPALAPVGPGRPAPDPATAGAPDAPGSAQVATSPAVGVFQPGSRAVAGTRVRSGDRLGAVDMLGVPQEVVAPVDGIVIGVIVEAGTAVEYGQELIQLEPAVPAEGR
jgi:biotin carboxyl carrier protein